MLGAANGTFLWQPVDQHIGRCYQRHMARSYDEWMSGTAAESYLEEGKIPASVRRILITHWAWKAYEDLENSREKAEEEETKSVFYRAFERGGCLVTADGDGDEFIDVMTMLQSEAPNMRLITPQEAETTKDFVIYLSDSDNEASGGENTDDENNNVEDEDENDEGGDDDSGNNDIVLRRSGRYCSCS